jgi:hypothetical protein
MNKSIMDYGYANSPAKVRKAFHSMMSRAKNRDRIAQAKFEEPPYYMRFLDSWTTRKEEYTNESDGIRGIYESSNGYVRGTDADCGADFARHDALE